MKCLAFDQATTTGWTIGASNLPLEKWKAGRFKAPKRPEQGERFILVEDGALALIDEFEPDLIVYEEIYDPSWDNARRVIAGEEARTEYARGTMQFLVGVKTAILMAAARRSIPTEGYATRSWRSVLQLPKPPTPPYDGMSAKQVREWQRRWVKKATINKLQAMGAHVEQQDEADAFGLCLYALTGRPAAARAQFDLLARVKEGL